jgi:uncharacterized protein (UPF0248 family)
MTQEFIPMHPTDPPPPVTPRQPEPRDHARVLRQAQAQGCRVVALTRIQDTPNVAGKVESVAVTDAFAVVGGIEIPLDRVIRVVLKRPAKPLPR